MRALFWFSMGAALSCCVGLWLLWDAVPLLLAGALLLAVSLAVLSRRFRWLRRAAAAALGLLLLRRWNAAQTTETRRGSKKHENDH